MFNKLRAFQQLSENKLKTYRHRPARRKRKEKRFRAKTDVETVWLSRKRYIYYISPHSAHKRKTRVRLTSKTSHVVSFNVHIQYLLV